MLVHVSMSSCSCPGSLQPSWLVRLQEHARLSQAPCPMQAVLSAECSMCCLCWCAHGLCTAHRALDLRSLLKCLMETFTNFNLWGKREKEFAVGLLPKALCAGDGASCDSQQAAVLGIWQLKGTRCILMFGTNVI